LKQTDDTGLTKRFELLSYELKEVAIEAELCLVGGAVMVIAFNAEPDTRRIRDVFKPSALVLAASDRVARTLDLAADWLNGSVRRYLESGRASRPFLATSNLKVFGALPDYVLALKSASLPLETAPGAEEDIRYLLKFMDISSATDALRLIGHYFNERQLPADIEQRLSDVLA